MVDFTATILDRSYRHPLAPDHEILKFNLFLPSVVPSEGVGVVAYTDLTGFNDCARRETVTPAQGPAHAFLSEGLAVAYATLPVCRSDAQPLLPDEDEAWNPGSNLFGPAYRGNGTIADWDNSDPAAWPGAFPAGYAAAYPGRPHPAVDPEWLDCMKAFEWLVQHLHHHSRVGTDELPQLNGRVATFGLSAGATAQVRCVFGPDAADPGETDQRSKSSRPECSVFNIGNYYFPLMDATLPAFILADEASAPDWDEPAPTWADVPLARRQRCAAWQLARQGGGVPPLVLGAGGFSGALDADLALLPGRYLDPPPTELASVPHDSWHLYKIKGDFPSAQLAVVNAGEDTAPQVGTSITHDFDAADVTAQYAWFADRVAEVIQVALIVEDGSVVAGAESYVTVTQANTYVEKHLFSTTWDALTTTLKEKYLRIATQAIDTKYGSGWKGTLVSLEQTLDWPRYSAFDKDGVFFDGNEIPQQLKDAVVELAVKVAEGGEVFADENPVGGIKKSKVKIGPIEILDEFASGASPQTKFKKVDSLLAELLHGGLSFGMTLERV